MRFETFFRHQATRWASGVFHEFGYVIDDPEQPEDIRRRLLELRPFFNQHLPAPKGQAIDRRAIFWFKMVPDLAAPGRVSPWKRRPLTKLAARTPRVAVPSDRLVDRPKASDVIARLHEAMELLNRAGVHTRAITTTKPGYVVFEDEYQIAAIPFRDLRAETGLDYFLEY